MRPGAALQMIMDEQGITHIQLAERVGVTDRCISARVSDRHAMNFGTLAKMYGAVGYKIVAAPIEGGGKVYDLDWAER